MALTIVSDSSPVCLFYDAVLLASHGVEKVREGRIGVIRQRLQPNVPLEEGLEDGVEELLSPCDLVTIMHVYGSQNRLHDIRQSLCHGCVSGQNSSHVQSPLPSEVQPLPKIVAVACLSFPRFRALFGGEIEFLTHKE